MRGLTGNLNVPGGDVFLTPAPFTRPGRFFLLKKYPRRTERILGDRFKIAQYSAFIPPHAMTRAILDEAPYPIRAAMFILTNPMVSYPNSQETYQALMKLDFIVVSELFMTPTAALADIVLPVAWGMEHEELGYWPGWYEEIRAHPKVVDPPGECWPDTKIINELAKRMGFREDFWEDDEEALDVMLEPSGLTYEAFKEKRVLHARKEYKRNDYRTPSNKIEIYSEQLKEMGHAPMPLWEALSPQPDIAGEYPLLFTNAKEEAYMLSGYKQVPTVRKIRPEPVVELNPETAEKMGLREGDWIYIETKEGRVRQRLSLNDDIDRRVVIGAFGWWFPEEASSLYGWEKANINMLTPSGPDFDPLTGSTQLRGIPCRVYLAESYVSEFEDRGPLDRVPEKGDVHK
jgi:anaerobic selenocysteine-containing dehydrogenase